MLYRYIIAALCTLMLGVISCQENTTQQSRLLEKERVELKKKESLLLSKQIQYESQLKNRDSLLEEKDSLLALQLSKQIEGPWNGKMVCTESTCPEHAVGDTRIDQWILRSEKGKIIAINVNKFGSQRIYHGTIENQKISLVDSAPSSQNDVQMEIVLDRLEQDRLTGRRTLQKGKECTSLFTIELNRVK